MWAMPPYPSRFDVPMSGIAFVPLTPEMLDADYAAVMRDIPMLRAWSGQDWPTPEFTKIENLVDLVRHDQEQRDGMALTYSVLVDEIVQGCIYVRPFDEALSTRELEVPDSTPIPVNDTVVRGWAHLIDDEMLIASTRLFLTKWSFGFRRLWWQTNSLCPRQLLACDRLGLTDEILVAGSDRTWSHRAEPLVQE